MEFLLTLTDVQQVESSIFRVSAVETLQLKNNHNKKNTASNV